MREWTRALATVVLAGVVISMGVALLGSLQDNGPTNDYPATAPPTPLDRISSGAPGSSGTVVTATVWMTNGEQMKDVFAIVMGLVSDDIATALLYRAEGASEKKLFERTTRHGTRETSFTINLQGATVRQSGEQFDAAIPGLLSDVSVYSAHGPSDQFLFSQFYWHPVVAVDVISNLLAAGIITASGQTAILGLPVTEYEAAVDGGDAVTARRVWVTNDGLKLRVEEWYRGNTGDPDVVYVVDDIATDVPLGESPLAEDDIDPPLLDGIATDYLESLEFNPQGGKDAPVLEAPHLLYPACGPISGTYSLASSAFISGTWDTLLLEDHVLHAIPMTIGQRHWWTAQEMVSGTASALVIQGLDADPIPPVNLPEVWPPTWIDQFTIGLLDWRYELESEGSFPDDVEYQHFALAASPHAIPDFKDPYDELVTWIEAGGIRVTLVARGAGVGDAPSLAEAFRRCAGKLE